MNNLTLDPQLTQLTFDSSSRLKVTGSELRAIGSAVGCCRRKWLGYLIVAAIYLAFVLGWSLYDYTVDDKKLYLWMIYLTHWTLVIQVLYLMEAAYIAYKSDEYGQAEGQPDEMVWPGTRWAFCWVLQSIAWPGSIAVSLLYWALVFDGSASAVSYQVHGANAVITLVDAFFSRNPLRLLHSWILMAYGAVFVLWSYIHYETDIGVPGSDERYIYSSLDWSNSGSAAVYTVVILFLVLPILYFAMYLWYWAGKSFVCTQTSPADSDVKELERYEAQSGVEMT